MPQRITGYTELIGLVAKPIRHSKSPMMHNTAFEALGLDYAYLVFEVDAPQLGSAVEGLRALGARGFNVSMPYKRAMLEYMDELMPAGALCGAVNTVINDNGHLIGTNTDGEGFTTACKNAGITLPGQKVTLLGAGGAGTALAMQAGLEGVAELSIFNRDDEFRPQAERNARTLNEQTACRAAAYPLEDRELLRAKIQESSVLINATSVGFGKQEGMCPIPDASYLRADLAVADVIYMPDQTPLLALAEQAGCRWINGIGMMLYQGAAAFKLGTGRDMPIEEVKAALGVV